MSTEIHLSLTYYVFLFVGGIVIGEWTSCCELLFELNQFMAESIVLFYDSVLFCEIFLIIFC
jgi:hypothetical protein